MYRLGIVQPSESSVASPVVIVWQKGKPRFCVDLRKVNEQTEADKYALPRQDDIFNALVNAIIFTVVDCNKGYHQLFLDEESRKLTAFTTEDAGLWEYLRVPFGLKNAPAFFQRVIDTILGKYRWDFVLAYIDDIVIFSKSFSEHLTHLAKVLDALAEAGFTISEEKSHFGYSDINILGHKVSRLGLSTQDEKIKAIRDLPFPETLADAWTIFGTLNYHRGFVKNFSKIATPLTDALCLTAEEKKLLKKSSSKKISPALRKKSFPCTPEMETAFNRIKAAICSKPVLMLPDFNKPFLLYVDASKSGLGAALYQKSSIDNKEHPILFISRTLKPAEKNYTATELECLGLIWSLKKLAHYVDGANLTVVTDHSALKWIWNIKEPVNQRLLRWSLFLNPLKDKIKIIHRPGTNHTNVDPLSRYPSTYATTTTHISISKEWRTRFQSGYINDPFFASIWKKLNENKRNTQENGKENVTKNLDRVNRDTDPFTEGEMSLLEEEKETLEKKDMLSEEIADEEMMIDTERNISCTSDTPKDKTIYSIVNGLLYATPPEASNLRLCVPDSCVNDVISLVHSANHLGRKKTYQSIASRFHFPKMRKMIYDYVDGCNNCQISKHSTSKKPGLLNPIPTTPTPFHTITIDFVVGLPMSSDKQNAMLTITDKFTKAVKFIPCDETITAKQTADLYLQHAYTTFGLPAKIISDRDPKFTSTFWQTLCHNLGIKLGLTTAYHPAADGQSEKTNQTIETALRCLIGGDIDKYPKWTSYLPILEHEINSTKNASTGFTPNELRYTMPPRSIPDAIIDSTIISNAAAETLTNELQNKRKEAIQAISDAQKLQKKYYDKKKSTRVFEEGELVILKFGKKNSKGYKPPKEHTSAGSAVKYLHNLNSFR